jgi:hypothetical protein
MAARFLGLSVLLCGIVSVVLSSGCEDSHRPCEMTGSGCECSASLMPEENVSCDAEGLGEEAFCCQEWLNGRDACFCVLPVCRRTADNPDFCYCAGGLVLNDDDTVVVECVPLEGQTCCVRFGGPNGAPCKCAPGECDSYSTEVPSCSAELTKDCGAFSDPVSSCD